MTHLEVSNALARRIAKLATTWIDATGTVDPQAERCLVVGFTTRNGPVVCALSRYHDGRYCLATFSQGEEPGQVPADQAVLARCFEVAVGRVVGGAVGEG